MDIRSKQIFLNTLVICYYCLSHCTWSNSEQGDCFHWGGGRGVVVDNVIAKWMCFLGNEAETKEYFFQKLMFLYFRENHYTMQVFQQLRPSIIKTSQSKFYLTRDQALWWALSKNEKKAWYKLKQPTKITSAYNSLQIFHTVEKWRNLLTLQI